MISNLLKSNNWCSNCQSSQCPCVQKDNPDEDYLGYNEDYEDETYLHDEDYADYEDFLEELNNKQDPQELEKATWIAENQQLNNNL